MFVHIIVYKFIIESTTFLKLMIIFCERSLSSLKIDINIFIFILYFILPNSYLKKVKKKKKSLDTGNVCIDNGYIWNITKTSIKYHRQKGKSHNTLSSCFE